MENLTLEKELQARIFLHKVAITGSVLTSIYMNKEKQGDVNIPDFQLREQASKHSNRIIQHALKEGTLDTLYENAWREVKNIMPEHTKAL